ncbi:LysR family transcriptional regulator [Geomonas sp. Red69]|uniref:LysR family transcriptional regulator n=1 Tax=Geomonas diazotrophica TaxID=2843197 RepID=A0ABX8JV26_9BACT|nr:MULTISPECIES: selenium metabolism-associated LysR family transcriptional regulator [Geomonas]MBU5637610.1 LysR family transcriptional regulator [Geomonas diazotrophica]QWV99270.1 LysR family transcriptional regulator [Geomonas nitrogeniifigens]QXE88437.1 LysR family transcriptional regulator [Geomonas nitrogeniifigens]
MNLKQLEVFIKVAESGSFSKGAEATFITQSTVSQHISALESEFGMKLLDRTGKGALPTEGGKILLERARKLVEYAREIPVALARFKGIEEAELNIAGSSIPGEYMIPAALPLLISRFPGVTIVLRQGDSRDVLGKLLSEEVELGVVGGRFEEETLEFAPFAEDELVLIAPFGHRWGEKSAIGKEELLGEPVVLRETGSGTGKAAAQALREAGIDPGTLRVAAHLGSNEAVKRAVIAGIGVSFVSAVSVQHELEQGTLIQVPVAGVSIKRQFYLASRKGRELSPAALAFRGIMLEMYRGNGALPVDS